MKTVMGMINLQENESLIQEITSDRPIAAIPFAGRYRLIDFSLSSMVNSKIQNVGILLPKKSRSIMDHLRSGKDWDLARKQDGLCYLPPAESKNDLRNGDVQSFHYHLDYIEHSAQQYILITGSHVIYNMNYEKVLRFHQNTGADITMVYHMREKNDLSSGAVLETADNGLLTDLAIMPATKPQAKVFMGIFLMEKNLFMDMIRKTYARGGTDFFIDGIMKHMDQYTIYGYQHQGYVARVTSISSYYQASMELLESKNWQELFLDGGLIYTKIKDEAPVKYKQSAVVSKSMVANGCIVEGTVENSILFRGVRIGKGVHVKNSIIMQKCELEDEASVENVICDKNVVITKGKWLKGAPNYPLIVEKGVVI
ncbi:glucose-1-phosphate adenylyltransferase subunit GlgD [Anaerosinus massiliensis]|uniref:glucose-1-phosphate adenylyltransferase subunit GlgD n=1 Tax=Massilibacillus massiliensis TaxID=1806837 RepID=UPI000AA7367B|nr:glucose-1-phosphate adenylyltransferase subunit GlgD [Massilibacillus massiliensis]